MSVYIILVGEWLSSDYLNCDWNYHTTNSISEHPTPVNINKNSKPYPIYIKYQTDGEWLGARDELKNNTLPNTTRVGFVNSWHQIA